ncbi:hypothetical protein COV18_06050 [Candidatus Woesearchaeota archaeon CG10_big_fil_rev_8_21_14_0_10_37_12]|nr:MAG: hypothetical protein COV18_06050 [Candidatus Woesearchaeota archaeon CG10_big_fil_rev_8_21_14_0_10_37_12]
MSCKPYSFIYWIKENLGKERRYHKSECERLNLQGDVKLVEKLQNNQLVKIAVIMLLIFTATYMMTKYTNIPLLKPL